MPVPDAILKLVQRFADNHADYKQSDYNETQARREFIDPFFSALGWDVDNAQGYAEAYKDVVHEDAIKISGSSRAPDYSFRVGGTRKFFVEAKKPFVNLNTDSDPAFQLRRYAWSAKLPLSILTDFEELAVYDGRIPPDKDDKPGVARVLYYHYTQYEAKWDEIAALFSREAILKGAFDRFADDKKAKRGTMEVDAAFLTQIEGWRSALAQNLARRNPQLSTRDLNYAVQITIDRIIFLRICGDRSIEDSSRLQALLNGKNVYERLCVQFREADERYNSGLFHFHSERGRDETDRDTLTLSLRIDDDVLKDILKSLYYPAPYAFEVFPADILGQVYEQFLGKVIVLDAKHRAVVEEKPEVRKAGGVYYTPSYIVDYIVKATVGRLLDGKTPRQAADLRFLDPACGSGSFLIGAYQYVLDWHLRWYLEDGAEKHAKGRDPKLYLAGAAGYRLTTSERRRILLNNFYGVDIDRQAVEVTKLSLLLKMLEGETQQSIGAQMSLSLGRVLPDLGSNIRCGNSLIAPDFYAGRQMTMLDEDEMYRVNVFDWKAAFPQILTGTDPGFDAVIGNPPWGSFFSGDDKSYLLKNYINKRGESESHLFFLELGLRLLSLKGYVGFITPNTWLSVNNSEETRKFLLQNARFDEICELSKYIFVKAPDIVPIIVTLSCGKPDAICKVLRANVTKVDAGNFAIVLTASEVDQNLWMNAKKSVINLRVSDAVSRITKQCFINSVPLSSIANVIYGVKTGDNGKFLSKIQSEQFSKRALKTGELKRYSIQHKSFYLDYNTNLAGYRTGSLEVPKIVVQYIRKISLPRRIIAALDESGEYYPLNNYSYITAKDERYSLFYMMGLLCSNLINFYFSNTFIDYNIKPTYLQQLPIHSIDFDNAQEKQQYAQIISLVEQMLHLNRQLEAASPATRNTLQTVRDACDAQIDAIVYQLYGLSQEEIDLVEGKG